MAVQITTDLKQQLEREGLNPDVILSDFACWKDGEDDSCYIFSHDVQNIRSKFLRHAHMIPVNDAKALKQWNYFWTKDRPHKRRSDRCVIYADGGSTNGFLVIALIADPGAHEIWEPSAQIKREKWEKIADNFIHFGTVV